MVKEFIKWIQSTKKYYEDEGIYIDFFKECVEGVEEPYAVVDYFTDRVMGRITVWGKGFADVELLDISTEKQVYYRHYEINHLVNWAEILEEFYLKLKESN